MAQLIDGKLISTQIKDELNNKGYKVEKSIRGRTIN